MPVVLIVVVLVGLAAAIGLGRHHGIFSAARLGRAALVAGRVRRPEVRLRHRDRPAPARRSDALVEGGTLLDTRRVVQAAGGRDCDRTG